MKKGSEKGVMECVLFPKVYQEYGALLESVGPFIVIGRVQSRIPGEANVIVEKIKKLNSKFGKESIEKLKNNCFFF